MLAILLTFLLARAKVAELTAPEIQAYGEALSALESRKPGATVGKLFDAALAVRSSLLREAGNESLIEGLSDVAFKSLTHRLPGIILNREEVLLAEPDPKFFLSLARRRGSAADVEFFQNYAATRPDGVWKSYTDQQTDVTGCTNFANGELVKRYGGWLAFQSTYPHAYSSVVREELAAIESEVSESTCACSTRTEVLRELERFARMFPEAAVTARVRNRIRAIRALSSSIRFNCQSG
ncbi:MAG TPA: hypothetical protein VNN25_23975 [Thermoanaerobaculia bacterium]|nr:hypothetical protein [Thermoanaerobaculia bacterium]